MRAVFTMKIGFNLRVYCKALMITLTRFTKTKIVFESVAFIWSLWYAVWCDPMIKRMCDLFL